MPMTHGPKKTVRRRWRNFSHVNMVGRERETRSDRLVLAIWRRPLKLDKLEDDRGD
jgi:hypothetical protein